MRWFLLVLILMFGSALSIDVKPQTHSGAQNTKGENRGTEKSPIFVKGDITTKKNEQETHDETKDRKEKSAIDNALVKYTGLAALFTFLLFLAAAVQVALFVWQLRLMRQATEDAGIAANAAKKSAHSLMISERARIFVEVHYGGSEYIAEHGNFPVNVSIKAFNHGKTAASITKITSFLTAQETAPNQTDIEKTGELFRDGFAIAPNDCYEFGPNTRLKTFKASDEFNFGVIWYCFGEISYKDIFNDPHTTGFCWQCRPKGGNRFDFCVNSPLNYQNRCEHHQSNCGENAKL